MKRILAIVLTAVLLAVAGIAFAEREAENTIRETIEIQEGKARRIEIRDFTSVKGLHSKPIVFQIKTTTDLETGRRSYCARLAYGGSLGKSSVEVSSQEIQESILTLNYLDQQFGGFQKYTEVSYKTKNGFRLGLESKGEKKTTDVRIYLYLNSDNACYVPLHRVKELVTAFESTAQELARVSGRTE